MFGELWPDWFEKLVSIISSTLFLSIGFRSQTQLSYFFLSFGHVTGVERRPGPAVRTALVPGTDAGIEVPWNGAGVAVPAVGTARARERHRRRGALERRRRGRTGRRYCSRARERCCVEVPWNGAGVAVPAVGTALAPWNGAGAAGLAVGTALVPWNVAGNEVPWNDAGVAGLAVRTALVPGNVAGVEVPWNGTGAAVPAVGTALVAVSFVEVFIVGLAPEDVMAVSFALNSKLPIKIYYSFFQHSCNDYKSVQYNDNMSKLLRQELIVVAVSLDRHHPVALFVLVAARGPVRRYTAPLDRLRLDVVPLTRRGQRGFNNDDHSYQQSRYCDSRSSSTPWCLLSTSRRSRGAGNSQCPMLFVIDARLYVLYLSSSTPCLVRDASIDGRAAWSIAVLLLGAVLLISACSRERRSGVGMLSRSHGLFAVLFCARGAVVLRRSGGRWVGTNSYVQIG